MYLDIGPLAALQAVIDAGSFERAAVQLSVSPSAVSQRIRTLERQVGAVVVQRAQPCVPTAVGEVLLRLARQSMSLQKEALSELHAPGPGPSERTVVPVAVNADSLNTWFRHVVRGAAKWRDVELRVHTRDQELLSRPVDEVVSGSLLLVG
ncbi:LysR family transcriptional regulator [Gordonia shandongensis]|uniref:LysR family transcriptional regulator n=1 Tax=Gordonia shandongensis TaxID=376351 RepID=UPI0006888992|nr:LysR family transcriptional regulator [Gordonia shandongensis]